MMHALVDTGPIRIDFGPGDVGDLDRYIQLQLSSNDCPERQLCIAIIKDAMHIVTTTTVRGRVHNQSYRDAAIWFKKNDLAVPFTFNYICEVLNLSPDLFLRRLKTHL